MSQNTEPSYVSGLSADNSSFTSIENNLRVYYCQGNSSSLVYLSLDWDSADNIFECARNASLEHVRFLGATGKSLTLVHVVILIATLSVSVTLFWL